MPQLHDNRKLKVRAARRALTQITPENSHPQTQSPLFFVLPSELRLSIFEFAVCQTVDCSRPVSNNSYTHRPGHEHAAHIDTALLRTCRLIYTETRHLPLRSATHHLYQEPRESFNPSDWDHYLFHLSSQSGYSLYHLHVTKWRGPFTFDNFLKPHLYWRKLTWTLCASEWTSPGLADHFDVAATLAKAHFPITCQEVNLEYESLMKFPKQRRLLRKCAHECKNRQLTRRDGSTLDLDYSREYAWKGTTWVPHRGDHHWEGDYMDAKYHVIRVCWRGKVPKREYMHYDRWDCLHSPTLIPFASERDTEEAEAA